MSEHHDSKLGAEPGRLEHAAASQQEDSLPRPEDKAPAAATDPEEVGGPVGPEPTRYGDWERKGRCIDF